MAPSKPKSHKNVVRPPVPSTGQNPPTNMSPELQQKFEVELTWCIQQLQTALKSGKLNNKQDEQVLKNAVEDRFEAVRFISFFSVQDHSKCLNSLMNNSAPMVKKRQVMRSCFGDYRAKMAAEEKKISKMIPNIEVEPDTHSTKSSFARKRTGVENTFRFNFKDPGNSDSSEMTSIPETDICQEYSSEKNSINFQPSKNTFRFGFEIQEELGT